MHNSFKRMTMFFTVVCLGFSMLSLHLARIVSTDTYVTAANKQNTYTLSLPTPRGFIYDRNGQPLVNTQKICVAAASPTPSNILPLFDHAIPTDRKTLIDAVEHHRPFLIQLQNDQIYRDDINLLTTFARYTQPQLAAHLIGHLDSEGVVGISGVEQCYDALLSAKGATTISFGTDALGKALKRAPQIEYGQINTNSVTLTIDKRIQSICEAAGNAHIQKGAILVMDPYRGALLAAASFPSFSPDNLANAVADEQNAPLINRCFYSYNVGSVFKIVTAAAAIESGIDLTIPYTCTGQINVSGQIFRCHKHEGHGQLDLNQAMTESCNPYFINLALQIGAQKLQNTARDFSFGKTVELCPGMLPQMGVLPTIAQLQNPAEVANFSFGQGLLTATPIQIAQMISCIVNNGNTPTAQLIMQTQTDGVISEVAPAPQLQAISAQSAKMIQQFLINAVANNEHAYAKPEHTTAGGKTATAQTGQYDQNGVEINTTWFAGFFPAENPNYVVVILSENGTSGNIDAAPVFRQIADAITMAEQGQ